MANQKLVPYIHTDGEVWDRLFVDVRSRVIYFEAKINGKRIKFSTKEKFPNGAKAKKFANKKLDEILGTKKLVVRNTIGEELDLFQKVKDAENHGYFNIKAYTRGIKDIREFWGDKMPTEINRDTLTEWYYWWSVNKKIEMENVIKWMRNFCKYLSQKSVNGIPILPAVPTITDPNRRQTMIDRANKKERVITGNEFHIIYYSAPNSLTMPNWVLQILALFMYLMATRIDETLNLEFDKTITLDEAIPKYRWFAGQNKADLVGQHAIPTILIEPLRRLKALRESEGTKLLFPQKLDNKKALREQMIDWDDWRTRASLGWHWTPHIFRHTCLTNVFNDPRIPQLVACKQYRISYQVALKVYVKTKEETMIMLRDIIEVKL